METGAAGPPMVAVPRPVVEERYPNTGPATTPSLQMVVQDALEPTRTPLPAILLDALLMATGVHGAVQGPVL